MKLHEETCLHIFDEYLKNRSYSPQTQKRYRRELGVFFTFMKEKFAVADAREVNAGHIYEYRKFLLRALNEKGRQRFLPGSQKGMIVCLKGFFRFLYRNEYVLSNPFDGISFEKVTVRSLRTGLSEKNMLGFLDSIGQIEILEIRDRTVFELMYCTGIRVSEVTKLDVTDLDLSAGRLLVREGKGRKDRIVPLGKHITGVIEMYLKKCRQNFLEKVTDSENRNSLFFSSRGARFGIFNIEGRLKKYYAEYAPGEKNICPHKIRHSFATHMLEHGAGVKDVKEILGHSEIESTVTYTHFSIGNLKKIIRMYHPRENQLYRELTAKEAEEIEVIMSGQ